MFKDLIRKTKEVYMDDMLVKSRMTGDHVEHLGQMFEILRKYQIKLNPLKCLWGRFKKLPWIHGQPVTDRGQPWKAKGALGDEFAQEAKRSNDYQAVATLITYRERQILVHIFSTC